MQILYKKYDGLQINRLFQKNQGWAQDYQLNNQNYSNFWKSINSMTKNYKNQKEDL